MAGAGATLATPELTNNAAATPESSTQMILVGINHISKLAPQRGFEIQELIADSDIYVALAASSGANNDDSTYLESCENWPENQDNTLDLSYIIEEFGNLHKFIIANLAKINTSRALFTLFHDINPTELAGGEGTLT